MEPFTIHCETCRAKLRVRDERVLGQIHECPRCGSMVHIAPPAALAAAAAPVVASATPTVEFPAAAVAATAESPTPPPLEEAAASFAWPQVVFWAAGGTALFIAGVIITAFALRRDAGEVAQATPASPPVAASTVEPSHVDEVEAAAPAEAIAPVEETAPVQMFAVPLIVADEPREPALTVELDEPAIVDERPTPEPTSPPVVHTPPAAAALAPEIDEPKPTRTLTLEPVAGRHPSVGELVDSFATPDYEEEVEAEAAAPDAKTQAEGTPVQVTNIKDRLALPITAIEIDAMPLSTFVAMMSEMAAVPITVDPSVLRSVGASPRTPVSVRARGETIESLLASALAPHRLQVEERDGALAIARAQ